MKEDYLPRHMRLGWVNRIIRFIFGPLSIIAVLCLLNYYAEYKEINDMCYKRNICYSNCINDNFPSLVCGQENITLEY